MKKRKAVDLKKSKRDFSRSASRTHQKNVGGNPMRGGVRL